MVETATLKFTTPSDCELAFTRVFDAPRRLVFDAFTKPELIKRWFHGPPGSEMVVCEVDFRVGGRYHYVWHTKGRQIGINGVYQDIVRSERIVNTESFDQTPGEAVITTQFAEHHGRTTLTMTMAFDSRETRDIAMKSGMEKGIEPAYRNLDVVLESMKEKAVTITTPTDRETVIARLFDAPSGMVFDALTQPALLKRWMAAPGRALEICDVDLRVGGSYRFVFRGPSKKDLGVRGVYREVVPGARLVHNETWEDWDAGEVLVTTTLVEQGRKTLLTTTALYPSREVRDSILTSGLEANAQESYDRLAEALTAR